MSTRPWHYAEAERIAGTITGQEIPASAAAAVAAVAQVHATLALAAATALGRLGEGGRPYEDDRVAWVAVASEVPAASARRRAAERAEAAELREKEG